MPYKDPEKRREYDRQWKKNNPEKFRQYLDRHATKRKLLYRKKHPQVRKYAYDSYHDFETHHELAMSSGIQSQNEWLECFKLGLMPDGIYQSPYRAFRRK